MAKKDIKNEKSKNGFGKEVKSELKKVTWPTPKQLVNDTSAVLSIVIIVALIVFILDVCFENINKFGVEKLKNAVSSNTEGAEDEDSEDTSDVELIDGSTYTTDDSSDEITLDGTEETTETDTQVVEGEETTSEAEVTE